MRPKSVLMRPPDESLGKHGAVVPVKIGPFGIIMMPPLMKACAEGNGELVRHLLHEISAEALEFEIVRARDDWAGSSCLHWAAYSGNASVVSELLAKKADPTQINKRGHALPLHLAARYNIDGSVIELLCDKSPPELVNATNTNGNTPLHEAAYEGRPATVQMLLHCGASVEMPNHTSRGGLTPLLAAVQYGNLEVVQMLLRTGANPADSPLSAIPGVDVQTPDAELRQTQARRVQRGKSTLRRLSAVAVGSRRAIASVQHEAVSELLMLPGHGALSVALRAGQLRVASMLLDWLVSRHGSAPHLFTRAQLTHIILRLWAIEPSNTEMLLQDESVHLFTLLVLCSRPRGAPPLSQEESGEGGEAQHSQLGAYAPLAPLEAAPAPEMASVPSWYNEPPNPVLLALQIASTCLIEQPYFKRDTVVFDRLAQASNYLEHIASGLLHGAVRATEEKREANKSFNQWRTGVEEVDPTDARDFFTQSCLNQAADYDLKVFVSNPFVSAHMLDTFWPTPGPEPEARVVQQVAQDADTSSNPIGRAVRELSSRWLRFGIEAVLSVLAHTLALPFMLFIPKALERQTEESMRLAINNPRTRSRFSLPIFWFFPAGRFALWTASILGLAWLVTFMPAPSPEDGLGSSEALLLGYMLGWCASRHRNAAVSLERASQSSSTSPIHSPSRAPSTAARFERDRARAASTTRTQVPRGALGADRRRPHARLPARTFPGLPPSLPSSLLRRPSIAFYRASFTDLPSPSIEPSSLTFHRLPPSLLR